MNLIQSLSPWISSESANCELRDIKNDSRLVMPGDLFIAYPGALTDGRDYIEQAIMAGAVAIAYEPDGFPQHIKLSKAVPHIAIPQLALRLAEIAQRFYTNPSHDMSVTGVTGTNGKTTIAYQLAQAHSLLQERAAYIGTIGQGEANRLQPLANTTPDALCLQQLIHQYRKAGIRHVCMEVSSHALSQGRVDAIEFKQALFTNLTLDHLDYHHTMDAYAAAKAQLFACSYLEYAIINQDAPYHQRMIEPVSNTTKIISYGMSEQSHVRAVHRHIDIHGTVIAIESPWGQHQLRIQALGKFNVYNSLAVFTSLMAHGYPVEAVIKVMKQLKAAPGRMELVINSPYVLVDYAHTPDALENVLITLNQLKKGDLWVIFGCGGDRDKTKRAIMGKAASQYADKVVVTSDNPRSEDPEQIINEIACGIPASTQLTKLINREEAIAYALNSANKEDIILIAGKGHEDYQLIGKQKYVFSDQEVVRRLILGI